MKQLQIIGLGPGDPKNLTMEASELLQSAERLVLRTGRHPVADWLHEIGVDFDTLDDLYEEALDFDELYEKSMDRLTGMEADCVTLAVPGDGLQNEVFTGEIVKKAKELNVEVSFSAGLSEAPGAAFAAGQYGALTMVAAQDLTDALIDPRRTLLVTQMDDPLLAGECKLLLSRRYDEEMMVTLVDSESGETVETALFGFDYAGLLGHTVTLVIPAVPLEKRVRFDYQDLLEVMRVLRSPEDGCPWDREQTHESLIPYVIEEAYEVVDAIRNDNPEQLSDELGDLLLQIVFHARVGEETAEFDDADVTTKICRKMIRRHPQLFGQGKQAQSWDEIKQKEKELKTKAQVLRDVPSTFPSLMRGVKMVSRGGFTEDAQTALSKADVCIDALTKLFEHNGCTASDAAEVFGDTLLHLCAAAKGMGVQPELALRDRIEKVIRAAESGETGEQK